LLWPLYLIRDLHINCEKLPVIYCDNQSAFHTLPIQCFMNVQITYKYIVILLEKSCNPKFWSFFMFSQKNR